MEKITITRALAELKLLKKKINDKIERASFVGLSQKRHGKIIETAKTAEEFKIDSKASMDAIKALIERYRLIKNAVIKSNNKIRVKIKNKTLSVAEAIEMKNSVEFEKTLLSRLSSDYNTALNRVEQDRIRIEDVVLKMLEQNLGTDRKAQKDTYENIANPFIDANKLTLIEGFNTEKEIEALRTSIEGFESEVDFILSESNSQNYIEI